MRFIILVFILFLSGCHDNLTINQITYNTKVRYKVTVEGHVNKPGLYLIDKGMTINQIIGKAGGYKIDALKIDDNIIIKDNLKIFINSTKILNKYNLNDCSASQLQTIKGIGPSLASKIIKHKQKYGDFKILTDLMLVKGIKEKKFRMIYEYLTIE